MSPISLRTKPRRHFPFLGRHPWVHAHALADPVAGEKGGAVPVVADVVELLDHDGNWVARGLINPSSRLRLRLYAFESNLEINDALFAQRVVAAIARRRLAGPIDPAAGERLVFSESDQISGLIVDRYANCLSVQFTAAALLPRGEFLIQTLLDELARRGTPCDRVVTRMDDATAKHEGVHEAGLAEIARWQRGVVGSAADSVVWYRHNDLEMAIDLQSGQKTGGYLDQRTNHAAAAALMAGRRVLDVCTYTGGFALSAAAAGATEVVAIDSSERALELAKQNADRNQLSNVSFVQADCFEELKRMEQSGEQFDAVILDPPRFAGSRHQLDTAIRAYTRLNAAAVGLLRPGGILVTCSCSGRVSRSDFLNVLLDVGKRKRRDLVVLENRGPAPDHPFPVACPESDYLKCVIAEVT